MVAFDIFHEMRKGGAMMLRLTERQAWLDYPLGVATAYTDAMLQSLGETPNADTTLYHTVYCDNLLAGMWAASGYPTVVLGHRTAAELMATKIRPEEAAEFVRAPWPAFAIRVPMPLLTVDDDGRPLDAPLVMAASMPYKQDGLPTEDRWWYKIYTSSPRASRHAERYPEGMRGALCNVSLWGFNTPTSYLATANPRDLAPDHYERWDMEETTSRDQRSDILARALIIGCSLYLSGDPREREKRAAEFGATVKARTSKVRDGDTLPPYTSYELQSAIRINLHHAMRDYVQHGGRAPSVQTLVAGHWKRQAHGPGRLQRKLIHVRPYWRGDPDAPVSERVK